MEAEHFSYLGGLGRRDAHKQLRAAYLGGGNVGEKRAAVCVRGEGKWLKIHKFPLIVSRKPCSPSVW